MVREASPRKRCSSWEFDEKTRNQLSEKKSLGDLFQAGSSKMKGQGWSQEGKRRMVSGEVQGSQQGGTRPRRALGLQDGLWTLSEGQWKARREAWILEKSLWLCCGRKGLDVVVVRMGDLSQS